MRDAMRNYADMGWVIASVFALLVCIIIMIGCVMVMVIEAAVDYGLVLIILVCVICLIVEGVQWYDWWRSRRHKSDGK